MDIKITNSSRNPQIGYTYQIRSIWCRPRAEVTTDKGR